MPAAPLRSVACAYWMASVVPPPLAPTMGVPATGGGRDLDHLRVLARLERKELAHAAGGKQHAGTVGHQPLQARGVRLGRKAQLSVEIGQGKDRRPVDRAALSSSGFMASPQFIGMTSYN
jgi:hypothetical protein